VSLIRLEQITRHYPMGAETVHALRGVSVLVARGEYVAIMGPSGSGKSTFMNILGCLDVPTAGEYFLSGHSVGCLDNDALAKLRNQVIGFVFQGFNLLPRANLETNVALPLLYARVDKAERLERARHHLHQIGLGQFCKSLPSNISGGQQQRVAIARALAGKPSLILADEPTGNLDTQTSREIMDIFTRLNAEEGITIVLVTHEPDIAHYARRLVRFVDGRIVHDGGVEAAREGATC
jgi:putative ABC transport system ATP-binding protein